MRRAIAHMDLDTFFVSCERLADSRLNGLPILVGGTSDRGVVAACSYEARAFGVRSAMPMKMAKTLCPQAIIIKGNSANYMKQSDLVTEIIKNEVPLFEKSSIDEFYIDLTGMDKFFGAYQLTSELRQKIMRETGLPISFGLSSNKTISKIATGEAKPNNQIQVAYDQEKSFIAPLSVRKVPMVGQKTFHSLCRVGFKYIKTIQEVPVDYMGDLLGKNGITLWKKVNGLDDSPVRPFSERKSISTERTFDRDTIDVNRLQGILIAMAENLTFQLRRGQKLTGCISVKIRYSDFSTQTMQCKMAYNSADHVIIPRIKELFDKLYSKRLLIRLIGVKFSHLVTGTQQMNLFDQNSKRFQLYSAMDQIRDRYGDRSVLNAAGIDARTIGGINPFNGNAPALLANRKQ